MTEHSIDIVKTGLGRRVLAVNGEDAVAVIEPLLLLRDGPGHVERPDGAICWDESGPEGGAWIVRGKDVPDGWRRWLHLGGEGTIGLRPGFPACLYWALPPEPEPATERVPWHEVVGRTAILNGEPHEVRSVTWYDDRRVRLGYTTLDQIDHRVDLVHDDGTVEVLAEGGDQ